jgi:hypothetical protein
LDFLAEQLPLALQVALDVHLLFDPQFDLSPAHVLQAVPLHSFFGAVEQPASSPEKAAATRMVFGVIFIGTLSASMAQWQVV